MNSTTLMKWKTIIITTFSLKFYSYIVNNVEITLQPIRETMASPFKKKKKVRSCDDLTLTYYMYDSSTATISGYNFTTIQLLCPLLC
jgi:hypothetical protein